jgi:hypothetical protein
VRNTPLLIIRRWLAHLGNRAASTEFWVAKAGLLMPTAIATFVASPAMLDMMTGFAIAGASA